MSTLNATSSASAGSSASDFDFQHGDWIIHHRRLNQRLCDCQDWTEFSGRCTTWPTLGGLGNFEDNVLDLPEGSYRAVGMRSFDPVTRQWAIWWLDGRHPHLLDVPVVGQFEGGIGQFFADDTLNGQPIKVRFQWDRRQPQTPRWEQAFSADGGRTWETNWEMDFRRA